MAKQVNDDTRFTGVRLPTNIKPTHYDLRLKQNFKDFTYDGQVKISYQSNGGDDLPKSIVLHANGLKITDGSLDGEAKTNPLTTVIYSPQTETATLEFQEEISPTGTLNLNFTGTLNDSLKGFYRTALKLDGVDIYAATTQFEATDARRCFPCWDEPAIKATFSVTLIFEKFIDVKGKKYERVALSNMPEISRTGTDDEQEVVFDKTPIMSTYLLAFVIGPFEYIESTDTRCALRVYTVPGKTEFGRFALEVASKSLLYYEDYFGIPYPLPKMDLIAIPDFCSGAMENWGLVTYREICLLVDPKNTSTSVKQYVAIVVAHELAHQWFGNLVTMEWWTHLWLNEGFASFMEYLCTDHIFPDYDIWSQFVTDSYCRALNLDALHNSHPIEVTVKHPSEIDEIFDDISYNKGASIIRMLYTYIGDDNFRKGMKDYLTKFAYKNASTEDLWDALGAASNKPVRKLMQGWTAQKGYPWLSISYTRDGDRAKLSITQNKFSADGKLPEKDAEVKWMLPINVVTGNSPTGARQVCVLEDRSIDVTIDGVGDTWLKLNPGTIGLYRTAYPDEMLNWLISAISSQSLPPMDRLGIQNDYHALCEAGKVNSKSLLSLLLAFKSETNHTVWSSIDSCISRLSTVASNSDIKEKLKAFGRHLYAEIFTKLTWNTATNEKHVDALTRTLVLNRLIAFGETEVIEEAKRKFKAHVAKTEIVPADLRGVVYRAASQYGDDEMFENLLAIYRASDLSEEKERVGRALGFTQDEVRRRKVADFLLSDEVRNQDRIYILISLCATCPEAGFKILLDNKDKLKALYGTGPLMVRTVKFCTEFFSTHEKADEVTKFFENNPFPGCEMTVQQSIEKIRLAANWLERDETAMKEFLTAY